MITSEQLEAELRSLQEPNEESKLPRRWTPMRHHDTQLAFRNSPHRFNIVPAGRRSGKTERAKRRLIRKAMKGNGKANGRYAACAPTYAQTKRIFWQDLKAFSPKWLVRGRVSESELVIPYWNGSEIHVFGLDVPARIEGTPWDHVVIDETANTKPGAWDENVFPALADRNGTADLIGVPEGRNHYYDKWTRALKEVREKGLASTWGAYHWTSEEILDEEQIRIAKENLDELTYDQEYRASFVNFEGRAYYPFTESRHCHRLKYDPVQPLIFCFDFNVSPGVAAVVQEQILPGGVWGTGVIGEVYIPQNSNTPAVCRRLIRDWGQHKGRVVCYGDATGGARGTAKVSGSDWNIIADELRPVFGQQLWFNVPQANPRERVRLNSVNARLLSSRGVVRLVVDPQKAPHVVKDLEGVTLLKGGSGEVDKKKDPMLSHISDALGYHIVKEYPVRDQDLVSASQEFLV